MAFCAQCGEEMKPGARFCTNCGAPIPDLSQQSSGNTAVSPEASQQQNQYQRQEQSWNAAGGPYFAMSRAEMKAKAKEMLKGRNGLAILVLLLSGLILSAVSSVTFGIGGLVLSGVLGFGTCLVFLAIVRAQSADVGDMFAGFNRFGDTCVAGLLVALFTFLWSLLLIVPGIIKTYAYSMTFYILNDHPHMSATDAITASKTLMRGHKGDLFVLHLSFILWLLLSCLTFGILYIVYVGPYISATTAIFYEDLRQRQQPASK